VLITKIKISGYRIYKNLTLETNPNLNLGFGDGFGPQNSSPEFRSSAVAIPDCCGAASLAQTS
jgi:hypothetical protein